jgi:hypothetical protein
MKKNNGMNKKPNFNHDEGVVDNKFFKIIRLLEENDFEYRIAPSQTQPLPQKPLLKVGKPHSCSVWARRRIRMKTDID